jgi:hypothetical protein
LDIHTHTHTYIYIYIYIYTCIYFIFYFLSYWYVIHARYKSWILIYPPSWSYKGGMSRLKPKMGLVIAVNVTYMEHILPTLNVTYTPTLIKTLLSVFPQQQHLGPAYLESTKSQSPFTIPHNIQHIQTCNRINNNTSIAIIENKVKKITHCYKSTFNNPCDNNISKRNITCNSNLIHQEQNQI